MRFTFSISIKLTGYCLLIDHPVFLYFLSWSLSNNQYWICQTILPEKPRRLLSSCSETEKTEIPPPASPHFILCSRAIVVMRPLWQSFHHEWRTFKRWLALNLTKLSLFEKVRALDSRAPCRNSLFGIKSPWPENIVFEKCPSISCKTAHVPADSGGRGGTIQTSETMRNKFQNKFPALSQSWTQQAFANQFRVQPAIVWLVLAATAYILPFKDITIENLKS